MVMSVIIVLGVQVMSVIIVLGVQMPVLGGCAWLAIILVDMMSVVAPAA